MGTDASAPQTSGTSSGSKQKRRRGERGRNLYPPDNRVFVITSVGPGGQPLEPKEVRAKFRNAIGAAIRDKCTPAIPDWRKVPDSTKDVLWKKLCKNFRFPTGTAEIVKKHAMLQLGIAFRRWKSYLNVEYVQKGLDPFNEFGKILPSEWEKFVEQKTSEEALSISSQFKEKAKKNIHPHRLGTGGYAGKLELF